MAITFEQVAEAAEQIVANGDKPSVRLIRALIGGSPNTVAPLLNEWREGRPAIRAVDIDLDPRIGQIIAEMLHSASEQAARAAEQRAATAIDDYEEILKGSRESEQLAAELGAKLEEAEARIASLTRASEDAAAAAAIENKNQSDKIDGLRGQLTIERERADKAVQDLTRAEYRLEQIPKLEAEIVRLQPFERQTAVLEANLTSANASIDELRKRLESAQEQAQKASDAAAVSAREAYNARIAEQAAQARLESAARELADAKEQTKLAKADVAEAKKYEREAVAELKTLRDKVAEKPGK